MQELPRIPGFVNAHCHAFQRALRGRTEGGDFWAWRTSMLDVAEGLSLSHGQHGRAPRPEITALGAPAQRALERVAVRIDEAGQRQPFHAAHRHTRNGATSGRIRNEPAELSPLRGAYPCPVATRAVPASLAQLPNALTVARLLLIPLYVALIVPADGGRSWPAAIVFGLAGVTDQIDGYLARRWHVESAFGKIADPLADRLMIDAAVILLWNAGRLPWIALAIPARDLLLLAGYKPAVERGYRFEVNVLGKFATWLLYASLAFVMVTHDGATWPLVIFWTGVALAAAALAQYLLKARREVRV